MREMRRGSAKHRLAAVGGLCFAMAASRCHRQRGTLPEASQKAPRDASAAEQPRDAPYFLRFEVKLDVAFDARSIVGETKVLFDFPAVGPREIAFAATDLTLDEVSQGGARLSYRTSGKQLIVDLLPRAPTSPEQLTFRYHGTPSRGLVYGQNFVYADYFTCAWMICRDEPGDKATFQFELTAPARFRVVASGRLVDRTTVASPSDTGPSDRARSTWVEERPYPPYLFGFAAGDFTEASMSAGSTKLRFLGIAETPETLLKKLRDTPAVLRFFEEKAGVPFPHEEYVQIVIPGGEAQEKSSFSLLGSENLDPILDDPREDWVIVHELAHQWWGNLVTCRSWPHFWLNEGITSFMVAAYKEQRWGKAAYEREIALFRERHQRAIDAGHDVPIASSKPYPSLKIKRAITYAKGALFLHTLRQQIGDVAFWNGIQRYTQEHAGKTVESHDLQRAMENASARDLTQIFGAWVEE
jgi:aminopeptidase N